MFKLIRTRLSNFRAFKRAEILWENRGLVHVEGDNQDEEAFSSNGAAKSTAFANATCWCLYGEEIKPGLVDAVVSWTAGAKEGTWVEVVFRLGKDKIKVRRYRRHPAFENEILIWKNGHPLRGTTKTPTEETLESLLPMSKTVFLFTTVIGQGMSERFTALKPAARRALLEEIVGTGILDVARDRVRKRMSSNQVAHSGKSTAVDIETRGLDRRREEETRVRERLEKAEAGHDLVPGQEDVQHWEAKQVELQGQLDRAEAKVREARDALEAAEGSLDMAREDEQEAVRERINTNYPLKTVETRLRRLEDARDEDDPGVCFTCGQELAHEKWCESLDALRAEVDSLKGPAARADREATRAHELVERQDDLVGQRRREHRRANNKITELRGDLDEASTALARSREAVARQEAEVATIRTSLVEAVKAVEEVEQRVQEAEAALEEIEVERRHLRFWEARFPELRSQALSGALSLVNSRLEHYLAVLTGGAITVRLYEKGKRQDIEMEVDRPAPPGAEEWSGQAKRFGDLSGGEGDRVDVAFIFALNDLAASTSGVASNVLVADEVAKFVDAAGVERLVEILDEKARQRGTVIVISHDDKLKGLIGEQWRVTKKAGVAELRSA